MDEISVRKEILRAASVAGVALEEVPRSQAVAIRDSLRERYGRDKRYVLNCNNVADYVAVQHPDSWRWVEEYMRDERIYFLYEHPSEQVMFILAGTDLIKVLEESYGYEYLVTNESLAYLICHNDHDYIIGSGTAKPWVESLKPRHDEWVRTLRGS